MTINNSASIGAERIQREVALIMKGNLDSALDFVASEWDDLDEAYATQMGLTYVPLVLEHVETNIWTGDRPSLIEDETPLDHYPNVIIMVDTTLPAPTSIDQGNSFMAQLVVESIVKGDNEFDVDRRAKRTADAINLVMQQNRNLNGLTNPLPTDPTIRTSPTFQRREFRGSGDKIWMKLARLEYAIEKVSPYPTTWMNELFSVDQQ
jgi:hypothetical protein